MKFCKETVYPCRVGIHRIQPKQINQANSLSENKLKYLSTNPLHHQKKVTIKEKKVYTVVLAAFVRKKKIVCMVYVSFTQERDTQGKKKPTITNNKEKQNNKTIKTHTKTKQKNSLNKRARDLNSGT